MNRFLYLLFVLLSFTGVSYGQGTGGATLAIVNTQKGPTIAPPVQPALTIEGVSTTLGVPFTVTTHITQSYPVTGFVPGDFMVNSDGSVVIGSLVYVNDSTYTITITPSSATFLTVFIDANSVLSPLLVGNLPSNLLSFSYTPPTPTEDLINIYDEWVGNGGNVNGNIVRGSLNLMLSTSSYKFYDWGGTQRNYRILATGLVDAPVSGLVPLDGNSDYFTLPTNTYPGITGSISVAFLIKGSATASRTITIFDTNTNAPRLKTFLRISSGNTHMGISYNGVTYDCGAAFPYDNALHTLIVTVDGAGTTAKLWLDNVQQGSSFTITGGGLNANTGQVLYLFNGQGAPSNQFANVSVAKVRIYTEAISNIKVGILSTGDFQNTTPTSTPVRVAIRNGQSNISPPVADNYRNQYPGYLQTGLTSVYVWQQTSNSNKFVPIPDNADVYATSGAYSVRTGSNLKTAYDLRQKYPTDELRIIEFYQGATALAVAWENSVAGSLQNISLQYINNAMTLLKAEQRNIVSVKYFWHQGEGDAGTAPINYSTSISTTVTNGSANVSFSGAGPKPPMLPGMVMNIRGVSYTVNTVPTSTSLTFTSNYTGSTETITANTTNCSSNNYAFSYRKNLDTLDTNVRNAISTYYTDSVITIIVKLSNLAAVAGKEPHWALVQAGEISKVASAPLYYKFIDTDSDMGNGSLIPSTQFWGGNVHYRNPGETEIGRREVLFYYP